jgi:hypothetical protein
MGIPDRKLSVPVMPADWKVPDNFFHLPNEDYEAGPYELSNTVEGLHFQTWKLTYDVLSGDVIVTPEIYGIPQTIITVANITQCTFAFDQNAHISVAYTANGIGYLFWYDTGQTAWITTELEAGVINPTVCLDDKRTTQTDASDILLLYTIETAPDVFTLYCREQRDRFDPPYVLEVGTKKYIHKLGMHKVLRVQIGISNSVY